MFTPIFKKASRRVRRVFSLRKYSGGAYPFDVRQIIIYLYKTPVLKIEINF